MQKSTMVQRVSLITLGVGDLARSLAFYAEGLGWEVSPKSVPGSVAFFQLNGLVLALFPREELEKDAQVALTRGYGPITLAYNARSKAEVNTVMRQAEKAGAEVVKAAQDTFWGGYGGTFADPDSHLWEVAWNPFWHLDDDGNVWLEKA